MAAGAEIIVAITAMVIVLLSLWGMASPESLMSLVDSAMTKSWGLPFAVAVRIVLGVALLFAAATSKFPLLFKALGWLALIAAAALPIIGRERVSSMIQWFHRCPAALIRFWLVLGAAFGLTMLYGVSNALAAQVKS